MSFETIRPILSGIIGAMIAGWLATKWARWIPRTVGAKGRVQLLKEHRTTIRIANVLSFMGIMFALACYYGGWLHNNDWRGAGLGAGLMVFLPLCYIVVVNASRGMESIRECLAAYAISQRMPPIIFFTLVALLLLAGIMSIVSLVS